MTQANDPQSPALPANRRLMRVRNGEGGPGLVSDHAPLPAPGAGEIAVRIRASSLNFHDYLVASGGIPVTDGRVPLSDGAGEVVAIGAGVDTFAPGDRVLGTFFPDWPDGDPDPDRVARITGDSTDGYAADHVVMPAETFTAMPRNCDFAQAATLPCAGVTAWHALFRHGELRAGDTVVIQGTGGVAIIALQLAKAMGARIIAMTSSPEKAALLTGLGADVVLDYRAEPEWAPKVRELTAGRGADLIFEVAGGKHFAQSIAACRMGGRIAAIGFLSDPMVEMNVFDLLLNRVTIYGFAVGSHADQRDLVAFVERHGIEPVVDRSFALEDLSQAIDYQLSGRQFGKVAITV